MTGGPGNQRALDCGSGIGRITKHLLQRHFIKIDLVEQNPKFLVKAKDYLQESGKVGNFFCSGKLHNSATVVSKLFLDIRWTHY